MKNWDVVQYSREYPAFPQEQETNLLRPLEQLESYRQLGSHIGSELFSGLAQDLWNRDEITGADLANWLTGKEGTLRRVSPTVTSVVEKEVSQQLATHHLGAAASKITTVFVRPVHGRVGITLVEK